ncbi:hypothetical protein QAO71_17125 (plasmid) [Halopseudomonas sp. SMJS2]|uniref:hypothetical protein n=1 Tax=Halopseudomonas sp. SMJS2 TaxID=3041098 RepID=UPI0024536936|nr:hypothetical protein [Halopseudomonas sp. SMJS2]WGK63492.1 hypothetical protein QAO71_17125 [Halopseudomonas sp. SMJS2]
MAKKKYDFTISLQQAEYERGFFTIVYGGSATLYRREQVSMTLDEAIAYRDEISSQEERTHLASIRMTYTNDRSAPGLNKLDHLQKVGTQTRLSTEAAA